MTKSLSRALVCRNSSTFLSLFLAAIVSLTLFSTARAQFTFATDNAINYGGNWANGSDAGTGFGAWGFSTGTDTGSFLGNPANNGIANNLMGTTAFGMFSSANNGQYANRSRGFDTAMQVGDSFTFDWGINWDTGTGGGKGFDLKAGGTTLLNVNNSGSSAITGSAGVGTIDANYGTNNMLVTFTRSSASDYTFTMTRRSDGSTFSTNISSGLAVDNFNFYIGSQADNNGNRNMYFNDLAITNSGVYYTTQTESRALLGGGALVVSNNSTLTLTSDNNNFSGGSTIQSGSALHVGNGGGSGVITGNIANSGALVFNRTNAMEYSGVVSGTGNFTKSGSGSLTLSGNNTFGGVMTVTEGKLTVSTINNANEAGVLGESANAVVLGSSGQTGFLHYVGTTNASSTKGFTAASGGTAGLEVSNAATALTLSGVIGGSGDVQKGGAGTLVLAGANTFSGALNIHDGTVQVGSLSGLGDGTSIGIGKSGTTNVSTLLYTGNSATITKSISLASSNNVSGIINVANSDQTLTVSGQISGSSGLTKAGAGSLTLSGNNTFGGVLTVAEGKLTVATINNAGQAGVLGESANAVVLGSSGQTGFLHYVGTTNASSTKGFTAASGGTAGLEVSNAATALTLSGVIGGSGDVQKGGSGTLVLAGANTFSGALNIHDGTVQVGSLSGLGDGTSIGIGKSGTDNVSTLRYTGSSATISKSIALNSSNNVSGIIDVATSGETLTIGGQISGTSGLTKAGLGRLNLTASSSYNGPTTVSAGTLQLSGGSIANSTVSVSSGATLSGYGSVGRLEGAGDINPGNSPGIVTTTQVEPSGGLGFNLEFTGTAPAFNDAANSVNDLIRITGGTPFSQSLGAGNIINIYFSGSALFTSQPVTVTGGFFTDQPVSFASSINNANFQYYFASAGGSTSYNGISYRSLTEYESLLTTDLTVSVTTVAQSADFGSGAVNGQIMQFEVIPEPSTYALLGLGAVALGAHQWRRRRRTRV